MVGTLIVTVIEAWEKVVAPSVLMAIVRLGAVSSSRTTKLPRFCTTQHTRSIDPRTAAAEAADVHVRVRRKDQHVAMLTGKRMLGMDAGLTHTSPTPLGSKREATWHPRDSPAAQSHSTTLLIMIQWPL